jgi:hypothetical protein
MMMEEIRKIQFLKEQKWYTIHCATEPLPLLTMRYKPLQTATNRYKPLLLRKTLAMYAPFSYKFF